MKISKELIKGSTAMLVMSVLKKSRRNGKCIQNQSKKFSAFQVCKTLITDRPFSVNLEFIAL